MTTTEKKTRTIRLTDRPPVRIVDAEWPLIASGSGYSGEHKCQANVEAWLRVLRHADGRTVVYGYRGAGHGGQWIGYSDWYGGELLAAGASHADLVRAIRAAGDGIGEHCGYGAIDADAIVREVIGNLPAEDI